MNEQPSVSGIVQDVLLNMITSALNGWFGVVLSLVLVAGLALVGLYFTSATFRRIYNLINPPRGRQALYYNRGRRAGQVYRGGWAFDEEDGRWRYVNRELNGDSDGYRYGRRYTKYRNADGD